MSEQPLVLLVDDDASIRRLVALALEDLPIELLTCASVSDARQVLRVRPAKLVITDLMMPVESGFELLQQLADDPGLRAGALLAVFSAGLTGPTRARLAELGVWRELDKPVSMAALEACVTDALALAPARQVLQPGSNADAGGGADERRAIEQGFGGDAELYAAFRSQALLQFDADRQQGDQALRLADWPALHRLAHSLKGVLALLGYSQPAKLALALETAAGQREVAACAAGWPLLRDALPRSDDTK